MKPRKRLPDTRHSVTHKLSVEDLEMYITVGFYDNRQPGELFVKVAKNGTTIAGLMDAVCVLTSCLLQTGWPFSRVHDKLKGTRFPPDDDTYTSMLDAVVRVVYKLVKDGDGDPEKGYEGNDDAEVP